MKQTNNTNSDIIYDGLNPVVHIDKPEPRPGDRVILSRYNTFEALGILSPEAFFLYTFFALHNDKSEGQFSASTFCDNYDWSHEEYIAAYNELLFNEYLVTTSEESNALYFHDDPYVPLYLYSWGEADEAGKSGDEGDW